MRRAHRHGIFMGTVTYLKHEITLRTGTHGEEIAYCDVDGVHECFLGGLVEAKRFLRERKMGPHYGPAQATWTVRWSDSKQGSSHYGTREQALGDLAYYRTQGRTAVPEVTRTELCWHPCCDGSGEVKERGRSGRYTTRPCPHHQNAEDIIEGGWELLDEPVARPDVCAAVRAASTGTTPSDSMR